MSEFTVIYDPNDGASHIGLEMMSPTNVTRGVNTRIRKNSYNREGYQFIGWKAYRMSDKKICYTEMLTKKRRFFGEGDAPEGWVEHIYRDECMVAKLSNVDKDVIIMYAQWKIKEDFSNCTIAQNKKLIENRMTEREVVLYGTASYCEEFYNRYKEKLNIRCILLDSDMIPSLKEVKIPVKKFKRGLLNAEDYIIICHKVKIRLDGSYRIAKGNLVSQGCKIMEDFVRADVAETILEKKKLWIWLGYCQADTLRKDIFAMLPSVKQDYVLTAFRYGLDTLSKSYKYDDCKELLKICDYLTYVPLVFAEGKVDFSLDEYLPCDVKKVSLPRIPFRGYYPYRDSNMEIFHQYSIDGKLHWPFGYSEKIIDDLILQGKSEDEIYSELMREDLIPEKEIKKNLKLAYKFLEISEKTIDIKIVDFLKENLTKRLLYRDGLHYQNFVYFEIARRVAAFLELGCEKEINILEKEVEENGIQFIDFTEVPILPCVVKELGLDFITDDTLWRVRFTEKGTWRGTKETIIQMTRKEWIYSYVRYTKACKVLKAFWNEYKEIDTFID